MDNDVLRQAPLFSALDDEAASALRTSMAEASLRRGEVLFHEGDSGDRLYIVLEGKVKLGRTSSDGRENLLAILGPGQMFGELSASSTRARARPPSPRSPTPPSPRCPTRTCCAGSRAARWSPAACSPSSPRACARPTTSWPTWSSPTSPAAWPRPCIDLADRFGRSADDGVHVHHDLTQEELAQLVGASRETVNKALADFASRGWLRLEPRSVVIMDVERLGRRAR